MIWDVRLTGKAKKQADNLPKEVYETFEFLVREIRSYGPVQKNWPNYGKLKGQKDCYHCHIKKGKPTYVAVWKVINKKIQFVEVRYVGTHEGANYPRIC